MLSRKKHYVVHLVKGAGKKLKGLFVFHSPSYILNNRSRKIDNKATSANQASFDYSTVNIKGLKDKWYKIAFSYYKAVYDKTKKPSFDDDAKIVLLAYQSGNYLTALKPLSNLIKNDVLEANVSVGQYNIEFNCVNILKSILFNKTQYLRHNSCGVRYLDQYKEDTALFEKLASLKETNTDAKIIAFNLKKCDFDNRLLAIILSENNAQTHVSTQHMSNGSANESQYDAGPGPNLNPFTNPLHTPSPYR